MKRTASKPGMIRWIKKGGGTFTLNNRIIKKGQIFDARLEDIPEAFRDVVVRLDREVKETLSVAPKPLAKVEYFTKHRGSGYYNVVDTDGKVQNEKPLRKDEAEALIVSLQK